MAVVTIKGYDVLLDDELADDIDPSKWECRIASGAPYFRSVCRRGGKRKTIWLHRLAIGFPIAETVDHRNGNRLDNRKENLRACSNADNVRNRGMSRNNTSGFKGVHRLNSAKTRPWMAQIQGNGKRIYLGYFKTPQEAALAYNEAALRLYGDFARLNEV